MPMNIPNTKTYRRDSQPDVPTQIETNLIRLYGHFLKLYPLTFRTAFADEMCDVFAMSVSNASGNLGLLSVVLREGLNLPASIIAVRQQAFYNLPANLRRIRQVRLYVRSISTMISLFLLLTLRGVMSPSYQLYAQAIPFTLFLFIASVSMLMAVRWERIGGLLTGCSGVALGLFMSLYVYQMVPFEIQLGEAIVIGILWMLPFVIFGALFHQLSRYANARLVTP